MSKSKDDRWSQEHRALMAQRLSRLLLAGDEEALVRFRRQHLEGAPHCTLDELAIARELVERLVEQIHTGDGEGWMRVARACRELEPPELHDDEEAAGVTLVRPPRLDLPAPGPTPMSPAPSFGRGLGAPAVPERAQAMTATISRDLRAQFRVIDWALSWPIDDWARLTVELEARVNDGEAVWKDFGIEGGKAIQEAITDAWKARLRDPEIQRHFEASVSRHRHLRMRPALRGAQF